MNLRSLSYPNDEFAPSILSGRLICIVFFSERAHWPLYCFIWTMNLGILSCPDYDFYVVALSGRWLIVLTYPNYDLAVLSLSGLWLCVVSSKSFCQQLIVNLFPGNTNLIFTISSDGMTFNMLQTLPKLKPLTKGCLNIEDKTICNISNDMLKNRLHSLHLPRYYGISEMTSVHQYVEEL